VGVAALAAESVADLWRHARALADLGAREASPAHVRRALGALAVAGSGGDPDAFEREVVAVQRAFRRLALDPVPLFDAASALVDEDDSVARGVLVNVPRREAPPPRRPPLGL
jgi:hypothetical protein